jgi:hypothetical protein
MKAVRASWISALTCMLAVALAGCANNSNASQANLTGVSLTPTSPSISIGGTQVFTAVANYSNGMASQDVTSTALWSSSVPSVATVNEGTATGRSAGQSTITVSFTQGTSTVESSTNLTVLADQLAAEGGSAEVVFLSDPQMPPTSVKMDGLTVGSLERGSSFSMDVPTGVHTFISPDGHHTYSLNLRPSSPYVFKMLPPGRLELSDHGF